MKSVVPAVTVLMSCYNAARWLREAMDSVLAQTFTNFEFIIVDDGSNDETPNILRQYSTLDPRIVTITKANTGLGDSLNVGIRQARGEWIARLDADDICEPTRLARQIELAKANPSLVFIGTGLTIIDEDGAQLAIHHYPTRHAALLRHLRQVKKFPPHSSALYRTAAVRAIGGYRTRIRRAQDWDLWLRLSAMGELACIDEPLVRIRKHEGQVSHEESGKRQKIDSRISLTSYWIRLSGRADPVADDQTRFDTFRRWIENRLAAEDLYAVEALLTQLANAFYSRPNTLVGALKAIYISLKHPSIALRLSWQRFFGENLSRRMAREWTTNTKLPSIDSKYPI